MPTSRSLFFARLLTVSSLLVSWGAARSARAEFAVQVASSEAQAALVIAANGQVLWASTCVAGAPCAPAQAAPLPAPTAVVAGIGAEHVEVLELGDGRRAALVRFPLAQGGFYEALVAGPPQARGVPLVLYSGTTELAADAEGELQGQVIEVVDDAEHGRKIVYRGHVRPDFTLCGRQTLLGPEVLLAGDLRFHSAKLQRLSAGERAAATVLTPRPVARPSGGNVLSVVGASSAEGSPQALVDGDPATSWAEGRGGAGRGEFVVFRAPGEVPVGAFELTVPKRPAGAGAAMPERLFIATEKALFEVRLPPGDAGSATTFRLDLPEPHRVACAALVLDTAQAYHEAAPAAAEAGAAGPGAPGSEPAAPAFRAVDVHVAEFSAEVSVSDETLAAAVLALDGPVLAAAEAASLLQVAGRRAVKPLGAALPGYSAPGRARALGVLSSLPCGQGARAWAAALGTGEGDDTAEVRAHLEGCPQSRRVAKALARELKRADQARLGVLGETLATVSPKRALASLLRRLGRPARGSRAALRQGLVVAAAAEKSNSQIEAYLKPDTALPPLAQIELLAALGPRVVQFRGRAGERIAALLAGAPSFETRYRLLGPQAELARVDGAWADRLSRTLLSDPSPAVRTRAARAVVAGSEAVGSLVAALKDPVVRVRHAAAERLGQQRVPSAVPALAQVAIEDEWPLVRAASVRALGQLGTRLALKTLAEAAAEDDSAEVRRPALVLLGNLGAAKYADVARERLEDEDENVHVRAAAAGALAQLCSEPAVDLLTEYTVPLRALGGSEAQAVLGRASIAALGRLAPPDLATRLAPLRSAQTPAWVQQVAEAAASHPAPCAAIH